MESLLLVHSPLVGPSSWSQLAQEATEHYRHVIVPDLTFVAQLDGGWSQSFVQGAIDSVGDLDGAVVVVGHSGAGAFLPAIGTGVGDRLLALVFVDAVVPSESGDCTPGIEMKDLLDSVTVDGILLPWLEWWPPEVVAKLLPDEASLSAFLSDMPRLPRAFYDESIPMPEGWANIPSAYVKLSDGYDVEYELASERNWFASSLEADHLSIYTEPRLVLDAISEAVLAVTDRP